MTFYITFLLALIQTAPLEHPLNTTATSWVVLDVESRQGNIESAQILQGVNPFVDAALSSLRHAVLPAVESHITFVFLFRPRDFFSAPPVQSPQITSGDRPPLPTQLLDPGYPMSSIGEGAAVLELHITEAGDIDRVRLVDDAAGLAAQTEKALRSWKFQPATRNGTAVTGTMIVVASYIRPMINNNPPSTGGPYYPHSPAPEPPTFRDRGPVPPGL
jgi:hypothetical protein